MEGFGNHQGIGVPAEGHLDCAAENLAGRHRMNHWLENQINRSGLAEPGSVFFAAVEMTRMPMIVTDPNQPDNPVVFANGAFLDLTGYAEGEVIGRNCRFLQGARTDRETIQQIRDALQTRRPFAAEILNYRKDGTPFWNALFIGPIYGAGGELLYFFASQLDVTRRRSSEEAFRQSQKMEAIGQLTAGLAHDFNNMLQVVMGNLELATNRLRNMPDAEQVSKIIERADRGAKQAAKVTGQLLAFARKTRLEPRPTNLNLLIMEFGGMVARTLGEDITIDLKLDLALPACVVDPGQVEMALLNVLVNARDAMPDGGIVTVGTRVIALDAADVLSNGSNILPGRYIMLSVTDQGMGMDTDVLDRAIEPFFTTKGTGKGTGLGLAMVHGFVRQSGGLIEIDSEIGQGTTIRMLFPEAVSEQPGPALPNPALLGADAHGGTETILIVDDSTDVLDVAVMQLESLGYRVIAAENGEAALAILEREHEAARANSTGPGIDLLFTDIVMPGGINGLKLAERAGALMPGLPVLLATGYIEDLVAKGPRAAGMDVIGKPYRKSELSARVRASLDHRDRKAAPGAQQPRPHKEG